MSQTAPSPSAADPDPDLFRNYSPLADMLSRWVPAELGRDPGTMRPLLDATADELLRMESDIDTAAITLTHGLAAIGQMIVEGGTLEMSRGTVRDLGGLIVALGECAAELVNARIHLSDGLPGRPG
jgi:hypothetical protein